MCALPFSFEGGMWDKIVLVPDHCLSFYFSTSSSILFLHLSLSIIPRGWSGGAMVLGKLPVPGRPTTSITVGQGPIALAVGAGRGCLDIFTLIYPSLHFLPLFGRRPDID